MASYASMNSGAVVAVETIPDNLVPGRDVFTPDYAATLVTIPSGVNVGIGWTYSGSTFSPPVIPIEVLAKAVIRDASAAAAAVVAQVTPDPSHQSAFQNAAAIVNGSGGAAPGSGPLAAKFAALAAGYGLSAASFATLIIAFQGASLDLSTALSAITMAAASATTAAQLTTALAAFEASIAIVVAEVNAAGPPSPLIAPAAIVVVGVNA